MENMNVILKSFDGDPSEKTLLEAAFRDLPVHTCLSIANEPSVLPSLKAKDHRWMSAKNLRAGQYPDLDWNTIAPVDEELIEKMRHCEAQCLRMLERYAFPYDISFEKRKRQYLRHLKYWNHMLDRETIDLVLMNHVPHQCYDYVIYCLCKIKGIPTLYLDRALTTDSVFMVQDWKESSLEIRDRYKELNTRYRNSAEPVMLSENYEYLYSYYLQKQPIPWYKPKKNPDTYRGFFKKWCGRAVRLLFHNPAKLLAAVCSSEAWHRKLAEHRTFRLYEEHAKIPDLSVRYVYFPLHYQPEASTNPIAGAYTDQEIMVQLLASCLPPDIRIYVKEHPRQGERCRSEDFYHSLLGIPSVTFVPKDFDTYALTDRALFVASGVGTVIFEAMIRRKPAVMFGHYFYQYAPGVHPVRTKEDCQMAVDTILGNQAPFSERDVRLFLRAMDDCSTPSAGLPALSPHEKRSNAEKAELMGQMVARSIRALDKPKRPEHA